MKHLIGDTTIHPHPELADKSGLVSILLEQCRITECCLLLGDRHGSKGVAVGSFMMARENRGAAGGTNRCRDKHVAKTDALSRQLVHVGCLDHRVPGTSHLVPALIIGEEKDDVGLFGRLASGAETGRQEQGEQPCHGTVGHRRHRNLQLRGGNGSGEILREESEPH